MTIKQQMKQTPMLLVARQDKPVVIFVDASNVAIGAVLMQSDDNGDYRPVSYYSKRLTKAQMNYCVQDKEAYALISAVRAFSVYLSNVVTVFCDHKPLQYIHRMASANQRLLRWAMELQCYNVIIKHIAGRENKIADYLSRPCVVNNVISSSIDAERQICVFKDSAKQDNSAKVYLMTEDEVNHNIENKAKRGSHDTSFEPIATNKSSVNVANKQMRQL